jgi:hypothetical protein
MFTDSVKIKHVTVTLPPLSKKRVRVTVLPSSFLTTGIIDGYCKNNSIFIIKPSERRELAQPY